MELELAPEVRKKTITTFVFTRTGESDFILKGTERSPNPIRLKNARTKLLTMTSHYCLGDKKGYLETMYVEGAPTIFKEDVYVDKHGEYHSVSEKSKAEKEGWTLKPGLKTVYNLKSEKDEKKLYARSIEKGIKFEDGKLFQDKYGDDPTLLEYVQCHEENENAPNAKFNKRKFIKLWMFHSLQEEKIAAKKLDNLDAKAEAAVYIASLRTKTKQGYEYTEANENKINATLRILDMKHGLQEEDYNQKHLALANVADAKPAEFLQVVNGEFEELRRKIIVGIDFQILELPKKDKKEIVLVTGTNAKTGLPDKRNLITCNTNTKEEQVQELCIYFLLDKGTTDYRDFIMIGEAAKAK